MYKLLVLDRNIFFIIQLCKLFLLDRNTWYHITVWPKKKKNAYKTTKHKIEMIWGAYDKFPDFFHMGTFIDSTHMKL